MNHRLRYNVPVTELSKGMDAELGEPVEFWRDDHTLISSKTESGKHRPLLDIDFNATLVPSSRDGHYHLYLDGIEVDEDDYFEFLRACAEIGVISQGYLENSAKRGQTLVRRPGLKKLPGDVGSS